MTGAYDRLRSLRRLRMKAETLSESRERLKSAMVRVTVALTPAGGGGAGGTDKMAAQLAELEAIEDKLRACTAEAEKEQLDILGLLDDLTDEQYRIMSLRYINGLSWSQVARQASYSKANCFKLHAVALKMLGGKHKE